MWYLWTSLLVNISIQTFILLFQLKVLIIIILDFLVVYPGHSTGIAQGKMLESFSRPVVDGIAIGRERGLKHIYFAIKSNR